MSWNPARRLRRALDGRAVEAQFGVAGALPTRPRSGADRSPAARPSHARSLCIVSGKGGTGKSMVCASLASWFSRAQRTLVLDADLGVANAHILQDVTPERTLVDVVEGRATVRDVLVTLSSGLSLVGGGSGFSRMAELSAHEQQLLAAGIDELDADLDLVLVDSAAGLSSQTLSFAFASDLVLIVTTPDLTAMTDAYAFLKVYARKQGRGRVLLLVNRASDEGEAQRTAQRIREVASKFLGWSPEAVGSCPEDRAAFRCGQRRRPVIVGEPDSPLARSLVALARTLEEHLGPVVPAGLGRGLLEHLALEGEANGTHL